MIKNALNLVDRLAPPAMAYEYLSQRQTGHFAIIHRQRACGKHVHKLSTMIPNNILRSTHLVSPTCI